MDPFHRISKQGPCLTDREENGSDKRLVQLELVHETNDASSLMLFNMAVASVADFILLQISVDQLPYSQRLNSPVPNLLFCVKINIRCERMVISYVNGYLTPKTFLSKAQCTPLLAVLDQYLNLFPDAPGGLTFT